jgi:hypothetical protein
MQINWDSLGARLAMVVVGKAATRLSSVQCCHIGGSESWVAKRNERHRKCLTGGQLGNEERKGSAEILEREQRTTRPTRVYLRS